VASKFAVEGLSDVMRMELSSMGIKVCVVEPGNYIRGTQIFRNQVKNEIMELWDNLDDSTRASYTERRLELCWGMALSFVSSGCPDIVDVVNAMADTVTRVYPPERCVVGNLFMHGMVLMYQHFPEFFMDFIFRTQVPWMVRNSWSVSILKDLSFTLKNASILAELVFH